MPAGRHTEARGTRVVAAAPLPPAHGLVARSPTRYGTSRAGSEGEGGERMAKVLMMVADGVEDSEMMYPYYRLQ